jgi:hypothetical protein
MRVFVDPLGAISDHNAVGATLVFFVLFFCLGDHHGCGRRFSLTDSFTACTATLLPFFVVYQKLREVGASRCQIPLSVLLEVRVGWVPSGAES